MAATDTVVSTAAPDDKKIESKVNSDKSSAALNTSSEIDAPVGEAKPVSNKPATNASVEGSSAKTPDGVSDKANQPPAATAETDVMAKVASLPKAEDSLATSEPDIRYHPKLPYSYRIIKHNDLYTIIHRLSRIKDGQGNVITRFKRKVAYYRRVLPLFWRFSRMTTGSLGKRRMILYLLANVIMGGLLPALETKAGYELSTVVRTSLETRKLDVKTMMKAAAVEILANSIEKLLAEPTEQSKERLQYRYRAIVRACILKARIRLDSVTSADEKVIGKLRSANRLLAQNWQDSFLLEKLSTILTQTVALMSEGLLVASAAKGANKNMTIMILLMNLAFAARPYLRMRHYVTAITNPQYRRMDNMSKMAERAGAQDQLLGLRSYYLTEYQQAAASLGDIQVKEPNVYDDSFTNPYMHRFFEVLRQMYDTGIYVVYAFQSLQATTRPTGGVVATPAASLSDLHLMMNATRGFSTTLFELFKAMRGLHGTLEPIDNYFAIQELDPLLRISDNPIVFGDTKTVAGTDDSDLPQTSNASSADDDDATLVEAPTPAEPIEEEMPRQQGMKIEFKNVSFTYPNTRRKALDSVSFVINAGSLVSIVGESGCGKSTLIALLVRLHDPDSGQILINDQDIAYYEPESLYQNVSMLFQQTRKGTFTVREFVGLGNTALMDDLPAIQKACEDSGAHDIIMKLKYGYDTELEASHYWDDSVSVDLLLRRAQHIDRWQHERNGRLETLEKEDDTKDESTDEDSRQLLRKATIASTVVSAQTLIEWTKHAARFKLPHIRHNEAEILAEGYDDSKLDADNQESARFSGGQWAKVVLARSFLRNNVPLTIVDEFSAALDPQSEAKVFSKLLERKGRSTIIAITHRYHLAAKSDLIMVMKDAKLVESGTHASLMARPDGTGEYRKMYECTQPTTGKHVAIQTEEEDNLQLQEDVSGVVTGSDPSDSVVIVN